MRGVSSKTDRRAVLLRSALSAFVIIVLLMAVVPVQAGYAPGSGISNSSVSTYIVVFNDTPQLKTMAVQSASSMVESYGGHIKYRYNVINGMAVTLPDSLAEQLKTLPGVKYVEKDQVVHVLLDEAVPQIGADRVWVEGYNGTGIKVAVLDTGVDATHPDLNGTKVIAWKDFTSMNYMTPCDYHGHGTHVSGIIAGTGNASKNNPNGPYIGVAPNASLIEGKVLDNSGSGSVSDIIEGINWAVSEDADIISMSLGSTMHSQSMDNAVDNAIAQGVVVIIAAGNSGPSAGTISCPGDDLNAITVGAVDKSDRIASFSSRGPSNGNVKPDVTNVGVDVISARSKDASIGSPLPGNNYYMSMSGTSMATPMTAGVVALMLEKNPSLTPAKIKYILEKTAKPLDDQPVPNNNWGYGRLQARYAIDYPSSLYVSDSFPFSPGTILDSTPSVSITMENDGTMNWSHDNNVTIHALDDAAGIGDVITYMDPGQNVTYDQQYTWTISLRAPISQGTYDLRYRLFANNTPFGDSISKTIRVKDSIDPGTLQFNNSSDNVMRTSGSVIIRVNRTNGLDNIVTVNYTTIDGNATSGKDYLATKGTLTFVQDQQNASFNVPILNDGVYRGINKTVQLSLDTPGGGADLGYSSTILTIVDNNPQPVLQFSASNYIALENQTNCTLIVKRTANSHGPASVNYTISGGNATPGWDYVPANGTLSFKDGETSKSFNVTILDDHAFGPDRSINLTLSNQTNGSILGIPSTAVLTIKDSTINFTYHLNKGWNMISVPFELENSSVENFFPTDVRNNMSDMWWYDHGTWEYYSGIDGYSKKYAHLTNVEPGKGYYVLMTSNATFTMSGILNTTGVPAVGTGWTLFGVNGMNLINATTVYHDNLDMWYLENGTWYYYSDKDGYLSKYQHLKSLDPGKGYWVNYG